MDAFGTILHTYRAAPENTATLADLNATWAEDEYNIPLLGLDDDNRHFLLFAARKVPRSAGGQASAYAGQVVAQFGDVGDGVAGLRFVVVPDAAFSRLLTTISAAGRYVAVLKNKTAVETGVKLMGILRVAPAPVASPSSISGGSRH